MYQNPQSAGATSRVGAPFDLIPRHIKNSSLPSLLNQRFGPQAWTVLSELVQLDCRFNQHLPGEFWRSHKEISKATGLCRKTLSKYFHSFLKEGFLSLYSPGHNGRASRFRLPDVLPLLEVEKTNPRHFYRYAETLQEFLERTLDGGPIDLTDEVNPEEVGQASRLNKGKDIEGGFEGSPYDGQAEEIRTDQSPPPKEEMTSIEERIESMERKIDSILNAISSISEGPKTEAEQSEETATQSGKTEETIPNSQSPEGGGEREEAGGERKKYPQGGDEPTKLPTTHYKPPPNPESSATEGYTTQSSVTSGYTNEKNLREEKDRHREDEKKKKNSPQKDDEIIKLYRSTLSYRTGEFQVRGEDIQFLREMVRKFGCDRTRACLSLPYLRKYIAGARNPRGYLYTLLSNPERDFVRELEMERRIPTPHPLQTTSQIKDAISEGCGNPNPLVREVYEGLRERKPTTKLQWDAAVGDLVRSINDRLLEEAISSVGTHPQSTHHPLHTTNYPPGGDVFRAVLARHRRRREVVESAGMKLLDPDDFPWPCGSNGHPS